MVRAPLAALCTMVLIAAGLAQAAPVKVSVDPGDIARKQSPVRLILPAGSVPESLAAMLKQGVVAGEAKIPVQAETDAKGNVTLSWIEPELAAGKSVVRELTAADAAPSPFKLADGDGWTELSFDGKPVWRNMTKFDEKNFEETFKPFMHLYGLHDEGFITKGAGGMLTHHRGVFMGWNKTQAEGGEVFDSWHCTKGASQRFMKYQPDSLGAVYARTASVNEWVDNKKKPTVQDVRQMTVWRPEGGRMIIDCDLTVESLKGKVTLGGDAHHAGFHFRAANEVAGEGTSLKKGLADYIRPEGAKDLGNDIWGNCPWMTCLFSIKDHPYAVMLMDNPQNPKPTTFSARPYGRFGPFFVTDVQQDKPLQLNYRLLVMDAATKPTLADCQKLYDEFTHPVTAKLAE